MPEHLRITDVSIAAYLLLRGHRPELEKNGPTIYFIFERSASILSDLVSFETGEATVRVSEYARLLRGLRARMLNLRHSEPVR
jgi:hypothetical protein